MRYVTAYPVCALIVLPLAIMAGCEKEDGRPPLAQFRIIPEAICADGEIDPIMLDARESFDPFDDPPDRAAICELDSECPAGRLCIDTGEQTKERDATVRRCLAPLQYKWEFSDESAAIEETQENGAVVTVRFNQRRPIEIMLTVTDPEGLQSTRRRTLAINVTEPQICRVDADCPKNYICRSPRSQQKCDSAADCEGSCLSYPLESKRCETLTGPACRTDADCPFLLAEEEIPCLEYVGGNGKSAKTCGGLPPESALGCSKDDDCNFKCRASSDGSTTCGGFSLDSEAGQSCDTDDDCRKKCAEFAQRRCQEMQALCNTDADCLNENGEDKGPCMLAEDKYCQRPSICMPKTPCTRDADCFCSECLPPLVAETDADGNKIAGSKHCGPEEE